MNWKGWWLCAATRLELEAAWQAFYGASPLPPPLYGERVSADVQAWELGVYQTHSQGPWFSVTGAGIPWTQIRVSQGLHRLQPKGVLMVGLAGAYDGSELEIGDIVLGQSEQFGDLGLEWPETSDAINPEFKPLGSMPWAEAWQDHPLPLAEWPQEIFAAWPGLHLGKGLSVNLVTGTEATAGLRRRHFAADFETMEGAGCALACLAAATPCYQVRAISNRVGKRNMQSDLFRMALKNLTAFLIQAKEVPL
jgi:futalosine hydrolase